MLICDAIYAHRYAWEKAGILHRDISVSNIMIFEVVCNGKVERIGVLCDWDLCKYIEQMLPNQRPRTIDRTGTWYFRSALSLLFPGKPYYLSDDIESFIHVYHYCVLRFHLTSRTQNLEKHVQTVYASSFVRQSDGAYTGSEEKLEQMERSTPPMKVYGNPTLDAFLTDIARLYSRHYSTIDIRGYRERYNPPPVQPVRLEDTAATRFSKFAKRRRSDESLQLAEPEKPKVVQVAREGDRATRSPLRDHEALFNLFVRYISGIADEKGEVVRWPTTTTKCEDLFKGTSVAPHKANNFASSNPSHDGGYSLDE
ncbi:hypothetical protein L227DRAFT_61886 [Lentinus tigrinus ALCF2SS1-6]|uniref:Fungal-type protein kinase domain-containing protein n=2 Tax=Lentinus tigrinus TaxID=5365 RepID=A0A5C2RN77_9APHY|nr:hypothetical protein L227DRAFT_61886 [Lentinus tigrinus ALCF2SS1-6]